MNDPENSNDNADIERELSALLAKGSSNRHAGWLPEDQAPLVDERVRNLLRAYCRRELSSTLERAVEGIILRYHSWCRALIAIRSEESGNDFSG